MKFPKVLAVLFSALLLSSCISVSYSEDVAEEEDADDYVDVEGPFLVIRKFVEEKDVVVGQNFTVVTELFNAGASTANAIKITDTLDARTTLVDGELKNSIARVSSGSTARVSYTVSGIEKGTYKLPIATVTYKGDDDVPQTAYSSSPTTVVLTLLEKYTKIGLKAGSWATLGVLKDPEQYRNSSIFLAGVVGLFGIHWAYQSVSSARNTQKRNKALKEVEKY